MGDINLEPGERVVKQTSAGSARSLRVLTGGHLYLTNRRVIWNRQRFSLPLASVRSFQIPLTEIRDCRLARGLFRLFDMGPGLIVTTEAQEYRLILSQEYWPPNLWFSKARQEEWRQAIVGEARLHTS